MRVNLLPKLIFASFFFLQIYAKIGKERFYDPVVLPGIDLPELLGKRIDTIVLFAYKNGNSRGQNWEQIPLQIDEKHWQDWNVIKNGDCR